MQPEQPNPAAADAVESEVRSDEASEQPTSSGWHNLFGLLPGKKPTTDQVAEGTSTDEQTGTQAPSTKTLTLSQEDLERRVQAETDRREAKRQKDAVARQEQERLAAIDRKLDPTSPDFDPYAGAEERAAVQAAEKTNEQFVGLLQSVSQQHDSATLDVVMGALPKTEQDRILKLEGAGVGLEGRKLIVSEGLKALEKRWRAEGQRAAEAHLREDGIFRKQVFAEHRDEVEEPELLPANGASNRSGDPFINMILDDYDGMKGRRGSKRR